MAFIRGNNTIWHGRSINQLIVLSLDIAALCVAYVGAYWLRFEGQLADYPPLILRTLPVLLATKLISLYYFGLYRGMWRYTSLPDLMNILKGTVVGSTAGLTWFFLMERATNIPRSVVIIDGILTIIGLAATRLAIRLYFQNRSQGRETLRQRARRRKSLLIIGAGDAGEKVLREMQTNKRLSYHVVGFLDDDPSKHRRSIHGVKVLGGINNLDDVVAGKTVEEILIAAPSATSREMRRLVAVCEESGLPYRTVPGIGELIDGTVTPSAIRNVSYEDLMGRETIRLDVEEIQRVLAGKRILVTGAGGSIGAELCRQAARFGPQELVLLDRTENSLFHIDLEMRGKYPGLKIHSELADIQKLPKMMQILKVYQSQVILHAAAFKHVPMMELHPWEAVTNNVLGTASVLKAADAASVERFVMVSTDKAVRPTNVMGASKRAAELLTVCHGNHGMRCMTVRFGNVVGSDGSVIPLFKKQIEHGGPVTVTHPEVMRYFMTIPEAAQLILQAGAMGEGGETFILKMGEPIKILDLAKDLIRLSGFEPGEDIQIVFTELRPGEKLFEELITEGEGIVPTGHEKIMVLRGQVCHLEQLEKQVERLRLAAERRDAEEIKSAFKEIVPEYTPYQPSDENL